MPLVRVDAIEGRTDDEIKELLDAIHRALLSAFKVPSRDRYQIYHDHPLSRFVVEDTGLNIHRTHKLVVLTITSRPRSDDAKIQFYSDLCLELNRSCGIDASDVVVSIVTNSDADWSFGNARAQFVTGEL